MGSGDRHVVELLGMTYKTILLRADREARFRRTAESALAIASRFNAHVICLAPRPQTEASVGHALPRVAPGEAERMHSVLSREAQPSKTSWEWVDAAAGAESSQVTLSRARAADLIVLSAAEDAPQQTGHAVEDLILASGRPVMQLPKTGGSFVPGGTILIAWNGSREAAWATFGAMPLLKLARSVKLLYVASEDTDGARDALIQDSRQAMSRALARHGVRASSDEIALTIPEIGAALVSAAKAESANLIVMGGSGHMRSGELMLGRTTSHMLANSVIPLLVSH